MSLLTVYKASAGSGKTFQLTTEYLKIIFRNPDDFRNILAVTFTHKATAEMKARILRELQDLSHEIETRISHILCSELKINKTELFKKASIILKKILHNYSNFHISTIDSFFQGIISSFARDLGLQANFAVELNSDKILNAVVDSLMINLEKDPLLASWLIDFAEEKVMKGESWELKNEIKSLGKELFREEYAFEQLKSIAGERKEIIWGFRNKLILAKKEKGKRLNEIGKQAINEIARAGLTIEDFSNKWNGAMGYLGKLAVNAPFAPGARVAEASRNSEKWSTKSSEHRNLIVQLADNLLIGLLLAATQVYEEYFTVELLLSNIYSLGILSDLQVNISSYAQDHNLFLLDQSPWLINRLMDSNDAPFIYEKTGNQFQYFMIDEFQDTSSLQWKNFLPLIQNSLAQNKDCMLVGDVKQSIYRWRNSSWKTLAGMQNVPDSIKVLALDTNWRSRPLLIRFNNSLFTLASLSLQQKFNDSNKLSTFRQNSFSNAIPIAYEELIQNIPDKTDDKSGYAAIRFLDKKNESEPGTDESEENSGNLALEETRKFIDKLLDSNYQQKDIAILVRNKKEGTLVAEFLVNQVSNKNQVYRLISNDALYLEKSSAVKLIVSVMQWISDDKNECNNLFLVSEFSSSGENKAGAETFPLYSQGENIVPYLPAELVKSRNRLSFLPLFDLVEYIIFILKLTDQQGQYPYLQAFIDVVHEYCANESGSIPSFIEWWKENSFLYTINAPEEQDAIRIITIHKAKGLEFKAVILPFCKWNIDHSHAHMPILWCDTRSTEYGETGLVPIRYKKDIAESVFSEKYFDEKIQTYVDNLNLLYVAFTRAKDCLYAICELPGSNLYTIGNLIHDVFFVGKNEDEIRRLADRGLETFLQKHNSESALIEFGVIPKMEMREATESEPDLLKKICLPGNRIHIRAHSEEYFLPLLDPEREGKINRGLLIHRILSAIENEADVFPALDLMFQKGTISAEDAKLLAEEIKNMLKDPIIKSWFSPGWRIMRETGILVKSSGMLRPDRVIINNDRAVVVDYKTGERESEEYENQLRSYMSALRKMSFKEVKGYLWYLKLNKIQEVEEK